MGLLYEEKNQKQEPPIFCAPFFLNQRGKNDKNQRVEQKMPKIFDKREKTVDFWKKSVYNIPVLNVIRRFYAFGFIIVCGDIFGGRMRWS